MYNTCIACHSNTMNNSDNTAGQLARLFWNRESKNGSPWSYQLLCLLICTSHQFISYIMDVMRYISFIIQVHSMYRGVYKWVTMVIPMNISVHSGKPLHCEYATYGPVQHQNHKSTLEIHSAKSIQGRDFIQRSDNLALTKSVPANLPSRNNVIRMQPWPNLIHVTF